MMIQERSRKKPFSIALGAALLIQAATSLISGSIFLGPFTDLSDIRTVMLDTASNQAVAHFSIFLDIITALVIVWLGVLLYHLLRKTNQLWATTALALYIVEASMLIVSKFFGYAFIQVSVSYSSSNDSVLEAIGEMLLQVKDYSYSMHIVPFGIGAVLFYYLLYRSKAIPSWLSLWGLIAVIPVFFVTILGIFGIEIPFFVMLPYVPFEFFAGGYILIKGVSGQAFDASKAT
jgi:hypothetical protein